MGADLWIRVLGCPSCATGQGQTGSDGLVLVGVLAALPLVVALAVGFVVTRALERRRRAGDAPTSGADRSDDASP